MRDFYVFIPTAMAGPAGRGAELGQLFHREVLNNHSGLAISPTLIGSLVVMGGALFIPLGAILVGMIIKWFDWLYELGKTEPNRYKAAILQGFCFGAVFNIIVLAREGWTLSCRAWCSSALFSAPVWCWRSCCIGCSIPPG